MQLLLKVITCPLIEHEHRFTLCLSLFLLVGEFFLLDFYVILTSQITQRLGVTELLMLHDEVDGAAAFATSKAFADALCPGDVE